MTSLISASTIMTLYFLIHQVWNIGCRFVGDASIRITVCIYNVGNSFTGYKMMEILLISPRSIRIWAISPVSSLLIIYVILLIYLFKSKSSDFRGALVVMSSLTVWAIVRVLLRDDGYYRYIGFSIRDGLIFYISSFLVVAMGSIYFGLLREFKKPNSRFRIAYTITTVSTLCAIFTLLLLVEIGPDLNPYYPYWQPTQAVI